MPHKQLGFKTPPFVRISFLAKQKTRNGQSDVSSPLIVPIDCVLRYQILEGRQSV